MGTTEVVDLTPDIEGPLQLRLIVPDWACPQDLMRKRAVEALVLALGLRMVGPAWLTEMPWRISQAASRVKGCPL